MILPPLFAKRMIRQLGEDYPCFTKSIEKPAPRTFRISRLKNTEKNILDSLPASIRRIPWCALGYFTDDKPGVWLEHYLGWIYVQEAASMISAELLNPSPKHVVWDMTAAPGSKTTQIADMMGNKGVIIANEIDGRRVKALKFNLARMGVVNTIVTGMDAARMSLKETADRILLDAPCTNSATFRGNPQAAETWSMNQVKRCSKTQKAMIDNAIANLADDGVLVYSTCSLSPEENEAVIHHALENHDVQTAKTEKRIKSSPPILKWEGEKYREDVGECLRIYPQDNGTDGFFAAVLKK